MRIQTVYVTSDEKMHLTQAAAEHHADERYGEVVCKLAHELARLDKYTQFQQFVEENLPRFVQLSALKADMVVPQTEE